MATRFLGIICTAILSLQWICASAGNGPGSYEIKESFKEALVNLPSGDLLQRGREYSLCTPSKPDSAMVCYLILMSRDLDKSDDTDDLLIYTKSCINISTLYFNNFLDYPLAYQYIIRAQKIAEKHRFGHLLPYIYGNLSNQISVCESLNTGAEPSSFSQESMDYLHKALTLACEQKLWKIVLFAITNLYDETFLSNSNMLLHALNEYRNLPADSTSVYSLATKTFNDAISAFLNKDYESSRHNFRKFLTEYPDTAFGHYEICMQARLYEALSIGKQGREEEARELIRNLESECAGDMKIAMWFNNNMYILLSNAGKEDEANRYLLKYFIAKQQLADRGNVGGVHELKFKNELSQFSEELKNAKLKEERNRLWLSVILGMATIIITVLAVSLIYSKRKRKHIMELYKINMSNLTENVENIKNADTAVNIDMIENTDIVGNTDIADAGNGHDDCQADEKEDSPDSPADDKGNATIGNDIMEESKSLQLFQKVSDIMAGEQVFDPEFQLSRLCELAGSNARYVSFVIGKFHGKTFKALLSEIRIKKACMILSDPNCNAKLDAICCDVGFKSRTAFSIAFKNSTGLSPTEFRNASKRYSLNQ